MFRYGVQNVRRLENVPPIEIKPITLLLGRNSGGKSTLLRTFPLFRQSIMTRTSSPILWYGDLVDFGSFETAVSRSAEVAEIRVTFVIDSVSVEDRPFFFGDEYEYIRRSGQRYQVSEITYSIGVQRKGDRNRVSSISIHARRPQMRIVIEIDESNSVSRLMVDEEDVLRSIQPLRMQIASGSLFPDVRFLRSRDDQKREMFLSSSAGAVMPNLIKLLRRIIDKRTKDKTISSIAARLLSAGFPTNDNLSNATKQFGKMVGKVFDQIVTDPNGAELRELRAIMNAALVPPLIRSVVTQLRSILGGTLYIGPARARSERYYRYQDLSVSEIDPDGKNFPMFLNSLSKRQIDAFSSWVSSLFGYGVSVSRQTGHISLNLTDGDMETNIVDVGYGVSQILPVLGQIWWARERPISRENRTPLSLLAIEQPELHLHPAHQALLADALVGETTASNPSTGRMHYLVETHSETLVNRLGEFISVGKLAPSDVQVVLFEPQDGSTTTRVRTVQFDDTGALVDWPFGFFQPSVPNL